MPVKGYAAPAAGRPLEPFGFEPPPLGPHDVEIAVTHCGICHSDIHLIDDDWGMSRYPLVPGHEVVGHVAALGAEVRHLKPGQRVGVGWQAGSCLACEWCLRAQETACPHQVATCVGRPGGFAETLRVDSRFAFLLPDGLASAAAAPLLCAGATVYTPLREAARPAMAVGVIGVGGLGHVALQFARAFGCEVTAFSTSPDKENEARRLGAHRFVHARDAAQMKRAAASCDLLLSAVTVALDWPAWLGVLRPHGTLWLVGASPGTLNVAPGVLVMGQKTIRGSVIATRAVMGEMLQFAARHDLGAQVEEMPLAEVNAALERVRRNQARYRMVLRVAD